MTAAHVRPLREDDLAAADHVMRLAFGTFIGPSEPTEFMGDAQYVRPRWCSDPSAAFAVEHAGEVVGSNFATNWGSVGFFGPLSIRPDLWDRGIGRQLVEPVMDCFERWRTSHAGLFTFAQSPKHLSLYYRYGFRPRFLTAVMAKQIDTSRPEPTWTRYSDLPHNKKQAAAAACRELTNTVFDGLDVTREISAVAEQVLGDTVLVWDGSTLIGVAVCHCGPGTEAGSNTCYVKFGAARPGPDAQRHFQQLLDAAEHLAGSLRLTRVIAGVNTARHEAYSVLLDRSFRTEIQGVAMHRPNTDGYSRPGLFVLDDWR